MTMSAPSRSILASSSPAGADSSAGARHSFRGKRARRRGPHAQGRRAASMACARSSWNGRSLGPWAKELDGAAAVINLTGQEHQLASHRKESARDHLLARRLRARDRRRRSREQCSAAGVGAGERGRHLRQRRRRALRRECSARHTTSWRRCASSGRAHFARRSPRARGAWCCDSASCSAARAARSRCSRSSRAAGLGGTVGSGRQYICVDPSR